MFILAISCPTPGPGVGASLHSPKLFYDYTEMANFRCHDNKSDVICGNLSLTCLESGKWSDSPPTCCKLTLVPRQTLQHYF